MSSVSDPRLNFLKRINVGETRVEFEGSHVVLLCGGKVPPPKAAPEDDDPPIASLRDALCRRNLRIEFFMPEEVDDWLYDGLFKNLLSFERELAAICSIVVVVLESPGSIAELAAFSQLRELSAKLIAVKSSDFETAANLKSFINLGILRFLREAKQNAVRTYPWELRNPAGIPEQLVDDVLQDISEDVNGLSKSAVLDPQLASHVAVIIYQLVFTFAALKESEIYDYLELFGALTSRDDLKRKLFLLERFRILKRETYSDADFFVVGRHGFHKLRLVSNDEKKLDALRTNVECLEFYRHDTRQRNRHRALAKQGIR